MTAIWIIPLVITSVGLLLIAGFTRRVAEEADELRRTAARLGDLRPALVEVRNEAGALRAALRRR